MDFCESSKCEWAVNAIGNVLMSTSHFFVNDLICATIVDDYLIINHDIDRKTFFKIPVPVMPYIKAAPSVLVVTFNPEGEIIENDLSVEGFGQTFK